MDTPAPVVDVTVVVGAVAELVMVIGATAWLVVATGVVDPCPLTLSSKCNIGAV